MDESGDDDARVGGALNVLIQDIYHLLEVILWKRARTHEQKVVHRLVKDRDLGRILPKIDYFQEDPQLLDTHLESWVGQLWHAYLESLPIAATDVPNGHVRIPVAISKLLYTLCKVRGEKIIVGLFNNEPKYLEPLVLALEKATIVVELNTEEASTWEERYVLFLWLSHLLLAPFDLASISKATSTSDVAPEIDLPSDLPSIPSRLVPINLRYLGAATKEQSAAATQLVRMCLRPDMRKIGLLDAVAKYIIARLDHFPSLFVLHESLGDLNFLSRLVASGNQQEIGHLLPDILHICQSLNQDDDWLPLRSSAVARKMIIKIMRNIAIAGLQSEIEGLDPGEVLESAIELLLETLADGDTPVRMAASKSLSLITTQLDPDTSNDVLEAILGAMNEDILWDGETRNLVAVNPLKWHGLTLTLSHLLFRRALPPDKLSDVLNALLLALNFEHRSSTGSSIGTNVRDAANFGIWAIARRYTTAELAAVDVSQVRAADQNVKGLLVVQVLAIELIQSACLDPAGNVRRGSSAALQELVGRHPDTITCGISLVQIVDYHGVGLRASAMARATDAAMLDESYWAAVFKALREWRGLCAPDAPSRISAAKNIAQLSLVGDITRAPQMLDVLIGKTKALPFSKVGGRHGFVTAIAGLMNAGLSQEINEQRVVSTQSKSQTDRLLRTAFQLMSDPTEILPTDLDFFRSPMRRPELTVYATLQLIGLICSGLKSFGIDQHSTEVSTDQFVTFFELCFRRNESNILVLIPDTIRSLAYFMPNLNSKVQEWFQILDNEVGTTSKYPGVVLTMGAAEPLVANLNVNTDAMLAMIISRCSPPVDVYGRVGAFQALKEVLGHPCLDRERQVTTAKQIANAVLIGLNDVTVNDRGDVGSLVRIEALEMSISLWRFKNYLPQSIINTLYATVVRLSLEKLDKVRIIAATSLKYDEAPNSDFGNETLDSVAYFNDALELMALAGSSDLQEAILEGYCSGTGMGSEALIQVTRQALIQWMTSDAGVNATTVSLFVNIWIRVMSRNLKNDRIALPLLETMAFLGDYGMLGGVIDKQQDIK